MVDPVTERSRSSGKIQNLKKKRNAKITKKRTLHRS